MTYLILNICLILKLTYLIVKMTYLNLNIYLILKLTYLILLHKKYLFNFKLTLIFNNEAPDSMDVVLQIFYLILFLVMKVTRTKKEFNF